MSFTRPTLPGKRVPFCLRALGTKELPARIELNGVTYDRVGTFKHDFFAATGLYRGGGRRVVLKIGRREGFLGIPLAWAGILLTRHEAGLFEQLADLDGVPALIGPWQDDGLIHAYVPGHSLSKDKRVNDEFFARLRAMVEVLHQRRMAYVDLEKPQNVLVGEDGRPYLIDFQISWPWPAGRLVRSPLGRWLCRRLQQGDRYHLRKLQRRVRPDQLSTEELAASYARPWPVRLHRRLTAPATRFRRWVLSKVDPGHNEGERGQCDQTRDT